MRTTMQLHCRPWPYIAVINLFLCRSMGTRKPGLLSCANREYSYSPAQWQLQQWMGKIGPRDRVGRNTMLTQMAGLNRSSLGKHFVRCNSTASFDFPSNRLLPRLCETGRLASSKEWLFKVIYVTHNCLMRTWNHNPLVHLVLSVSLGGITQDEFGRLIDEAGSASIRSGAMIDEVMRGHLFVAVIGVSKL